MLFGRRQVIIANTKGTRPISFRARGVNVVDPIIRSSPSLRGGTFVAQDADGIQRILRSIVTHVRVPRTRFAGGVHCRTIKNRRQPMTRIRWLSATAGMLGLAAVMAGPASSAPLGPTGSLPQTVAQLNSALEQVHWLPWRHCHRSWHRGHRRIWCHGGHRRRHHRMY
jgi:hypothetical protein